MMQSMNDNPLGNARAAIRPTGFEQPETFYIPNYEHPETSSGGFFMVLLIAFTFAIALISGLAMEDSKGTDCKGQLVKIVDTQEYKCINPEVLRGK